jgi:predicted CxxxxCH...CXXCH cytochrome family protein
MILFVYVVVRCLYGHVMRTRISWLIVVATLTSGCLGSIESTGSDRPPASDPNTGCSMSCHGADTSNAPPKSTTGAMETTATAVGAHQAHMNPSPAWHLKVDCADCHSVPAEINSAGHMDGDGKAEVVFSPRSGVSMWTGTTCTSGCHGSSAWGGVKATPNWTLVDGSQSTCGSCHGAPPPAPHPAGSNCATCHPTMEENSLTFRDPDSHIDGKIDLTDAGATGGCTTCHGSPTSAAPPKDLAGNASSAKVGAHQAHLKTSTWRHAIPCSGCHVVPTTQAAPGHIDGDNLAEVRFDTLNPIGAFAGGTCSTNYCHGNGRGGNGTIAWTAIGPLACTSCHATNGTGMSGDHRRHIVEENMRCSECHGTVVNANMGIINADLHVNGVHEVKMAAGTYNPATRVCSNTGCHGNETW